MTLGGAAHARTVDTHLLPVLEKVVAATHELTGEGHELLRQRYQNHLRALGLRYLKVRAARCWGRGGGERGVGGEQAWCSAKLREARLCRRSGGRLQADSSKREAPTHVKRHAPRHVLPRRRHTQAVRLASAPARFLPLAVSNSCATPWPLARLWRPRTPARP